MGQLYDSWNYCFNKDIKYIPLEQIKVGKTYLYLHIYDMELETVGNNPGIPNESMIMVISEGTRSSLFGPRQRTLQVFVEGPPNKGYHEVLNLEEYGQYWILRYAV